MGDKWEAVIILDNGSSGCKAGLTGDMEPRVIYPSKGGRPLHQRIEGDNGTRFRFMGLDERAKVEELLFNEHPVKRGVVTHWDNMEAILHHLYDALDVKEASQRPILITEAPLNPKANREKMAQILFEKFNAPAVYFANPAVMALFSTGRTSGVVVDSGHDLTLVVPVQEGFASDESITRIELGGRDLENYLTGMMKEKGCDSSTNDTVRDIKEKVCEVALDFENDLLKVKGSTTSYELPDGRTINIDNQARFCCPEPLFQPFLLDKKDTENLPQTTFRSTERIDAIPRSQMLLNTVLVGGSTLFSGLVRRFEKEMKALAPPNTKIKIVAPSSRLNSAFCGASALSYLPTFQTMWIPKEKFEENGPSVLHLNPVKKFF